MVNLKHEVQKRGFIVAHIKTDSIKIPDATPEIIQFVMDYGKKYGYVFEHEATYDRMCLVNNAVYIAKYATAEKCQDAYGYIPGDIRKHPGEWTATGTQFQIPYVFKKLFSKEEIVFEDICETKSVTSALYLDTNETLPDVSGYEKELETLRKKWPDEHGQYPLDYEEVVADLKAKIEQGHNYIFVGKVGSFCPMKPGCNGGLLLREGVAVKESRGRLSYLTPDRTKPITARKLGDDFDRAAVLAVLEQNAARAAEKAAAIPEYQRHGKTGIQPTKAPQTAPNVQRLVDIEQKKAEGKGRGYERWATMHNLKQMAATLNVYQEYGFTSPEQLEAAVDTAYQDMRQTSGELKALETKLQGKKELQQQVLAYAKTKPARDGLKAQKSEKARAAYRQANESDFIIAEAAARYFKAHGITKLPARKALQAEIEQLISEKDGLYNTYHEQKQRFKELQTVKRNIDQILRRDEPHRRKEQSHER